MSSAECKRLNDESENADLGTDQKSPGDSEPYKSCFHIPKVPLSTDFEERTKLGFKPIPFEKGEYTSMCIELARQDMLTALVNYNNKIKIAREHATVGKWPKGALESARHTVEKLDKRYVSMLREHKIHVDEMKAKNEQRAAEKSKILEDLKNGLSSVFRETFMRVMEDEQSAEADNVDKANQANQAFHEASLAVKEEFKKHAAVINGLPVQCKLKAIKIANEHNLGEDDANLILDAAPIEEPASARQKQKRAKRSADEVSSNTVSPKKSKTGEQSSASKSATHSLSEALEQATDDDDDDDDDVVKYRAACTGGAGHGHGGPGL